MIEAIESMDLIRNNIDEIVTKAFETVNLDKILENPIETLKVIYLEIIRQNKQNFIDSQEIGERLANQIKGEI